MKENNLGNSYERKGKFIKKSGEQLFIKFHRLRHRIHLPYSSLDSWWKLNIKEVNVWISWRVIPKSIDRVQLKEIWKTRYPYLEKINFLSGMVDPWKVWSLISSLDHFQVFTFTNIPQAKSRICKFTEPEFRICWIKLCRSDNH